MVEKTAVSVLKSDRLIWAFKLEICSFLIMFVLYQIRSIPAYIFISRAIGKKLELD